MGEVIFVVLADLGDSSYLSFCLPLLGGILGVVRVRRGESHLILTQYLVVPENKLTVLFIVFYLKVKQPSKKVSLGFRGEN